MDYQQSYADSENSHLGHSPTPPSPPPPQSPQSVQPVTAADPQKPPPNVCADVKPRLSKEQHDILERHFQQQPKPSTATKKAFADQLGVSVDKINNWFQNRRAKVKQDLKKAQNAQQLINQQHIMGAYGAGHIPVMHQYPSMTSLWDVAVTSDIPVNRPVQTIDGPPALDLGTQMAHQQSFQMNHQLRPIPEAYGTGRPDQNHVLESLMAASAGPSYMPTQPALNPMQAPVYAFNGLPHDLQEPINFSVPTTQGVSQPFMDNYAIPAGNPVGSLSGSVEAQSLAVQPSSSEPSPFDRTDSAANSSNTGITSVNSLTSVFTGYEDDSQSQESFKPTSILERAPGESDTSVRTIVPGWEPDQRPLASGIYLDYQGNGDAEQAVPNPEESPEADVKLGMEQNVDAPQLLEFDYSTFPSDMYSRRNSSATNLANNIENIQLHNNFRQPSQPSSIADRRQKRPTALNSQTLRGGTVSGGVSSPGAPSENTIRRIRSSGAFGNATGRIQKPPSGQPQRSPLPSTFAEAAASPKFTRAFPTSTAITPGQGGNLAPPTPLTPNDGFTSCWPRNHLHDHNSPDSLNSASHPTGSSQAEENPTLGASPPSTPHGFAQWGMNNPAGLYHDTPPQSAPATQQSFSRSTFPHTAQMPPAYHSTSDLTIAQPKPSHYRRPSLDAGLLQMNDPNVYSTQLGNNMYPGHYAHPFVGFPQHNVPFAPSAPIPLQYNHSRTYIFANQGPRDFKP